MKLKGIFFVDQSTFGEETQDANQMNCSKISKCDETVKINRNHRPNRKAWGT